jgi:hypothetical protein
MTGMRLRAHARMKWKNSPLIAFVAPAQFNAEGGDLNQAGEPCGRADHNLGRDPAIA